MFTRVVAFVIVLFAASPLTQPFSTIAFGEVPATVAGHDALSGTPVGQDVCARDCAVTPPVDVRAVAGLDEPTLLTRRSTVIATTVIGRADERAVLRSRRRPETRFLVLFDRLVVLRV